MTMLPVPARDPIHRRINQYLGFAPKDWITIGMATVALLISATTAYFSVIRREDNLSVVFGNTPFIKKFDADNFVITTDETVLVFPNSGTRSAAVTAVSMFVMQHEGSSRCEYASTGNDGAWFTTTFEPISIKANEVITQRIKIGRTWALAKSNGPKPEPKLVPISAANKLKKRMDVEVCYAIYVATPSVATHVAHVSGEQYLVEENDSSYDPVDEKLPPSILLRSSGTIFGR